MRITDIHVGGFGIWSDLQVEHLNAGLTVIYGVNEAGKTTLMQFLRTMFYGLSPDRQRRYDPPVSGGPLGGTVRVESHIGELLLERYWPSARGGRDAHGRGQLKIHDGRDAERPAAVFESLLNGVDEPTYTNVFSIGLRELQELGTLDDTDAADLLYQLTTGLDRVSLIDVMRRLNHARARLLDSERHAGTMVELQNQYDRLRRHAGDTEATGRQWVALEQQLRSVDSELHDLAEQRDALQSDALLMQAALRVAPHWREYRQLSDQLESLASVREVPDATLERLRELRESIDQRREEVEEIRGRRREIHHEATSQPINRQLWHNASRIEALAEQSEWIASLQSEINQLRADIHVLEVRLADAPATGAGDSTDDSLANLPEVSSSTIGTLRGPARAVKEESDRLRQVETDLDQSQQQLDELSLKLETTLLELGYDDLDAGVSETGQTVTQLRRHVQSGDRLEDLLRRRQQLDEERLELLDRQVLSPAALAWLGIPFIIGVALILGGIVWRSAASLGWPMALMGLGAWAFGIVVKTMLERNAARELDDCESQLGRLQRQIEATQKTQDESASSAIRSSDPLAAQLSTAERQLAELEQLLPMQATCETLRQRIAAATRRREQLNHALHEARTRWHQALRRAGLPETLSIAAIRQLAAGSRANSQLRRQLNNRRDELGARERELTALALRIDELAHQTNLTTATDDPQVQLRQLVATVAEQERLFKRRDELRQEDRQLRRRGRDLAAKLRKMQHERRALIAQTGVLNEKQLQQLIARHVQRRQLVADRKAARHSLLSAIGDQYDLESIDTTLGGQDPAALEQQLQQATLECQHIDARRAKLLQRRGQVVQEQKMLAADRQPTLQRIKQREVEQQLQSATRRWAVLSATNHLLETVRETYETQRQPETLREASRYFQQLTAGQYVRIWTPLTEQSLRVDAADGSSLSVDVLSSGTREAVFLSLRLALVADFARRGSQLPLVLDDVLVNFDIRRARAAAEVLCQFAQANRQILLFTCHDHIVELFAREQAEIRVLPERSGHVPEPVPVTPEQPAPIQEEPAPIPDEPVEEIDDSPYQLADPVPVLMPPADIPTIEPVESEPVVASDDDPQLWQLVEEPLEDEPLDFVMPPDDYEIRFAPEPEPSDEVILEPVDLSFADLGFVAEPAVEPMLAEPQEKWHVDLEVVEESLPIDRTALQAETDRRFAWESPERYRGDSAAA